MEQVSQVAPWLQNLGAGANVAGIGASAYGSYLQAQQADKQYQMALQAWQQEQSRQRKMDANAMQQQGMQNNMAAGNYASGQADDIEDPYIAYAKRLGL